MYTKPSFHDMIVKMTIIAVFLKYTTPFEIPCSRFQCTLLMKCYDVLFMRVVFFKILNKL